MADVCLTLLCSPALEEKLLDLLLMSPHPTLFTSAATAAHGLADGELSQTEQVLGRAFATQVQVIFDESYRDALLEEIRRQFAGARVHYWLVPVIEAGETT